MSDEELIAWLRKPYGDAMMERAADRIEALTKERDDYAWKLNNANNIYTEMHVELETLEDKLATCEKYRDAYAEMGRIGTQAVRDLEAKLAKAEAGLLAIAKRDEQMIWGEDYEVEEAFKDMRDISCATLAEIKGLNKGESHE